MKKFFAVILFALVVLSDNAKVNADEKSVKRLFSLLMIMQELSITGNMPLLQVELQLTKKFRKK